MVSAATLARAREVAAAVNDPELPMLTLADLGILRDVVEQDGAITVTITPTYSGCPAMATMRDDLRASLQRNGFPKVEIKVSLQPAWTTDWISERGRSALREHGISAPGRAPVRSGPIPLSLRPTRRSVHCPRCGSDRVSLTSEFGATACKAIYRCDACWEPFEHVKEL